MADPQIAHAVAIHITPANNTALADANKLEENTTFSLSIATTLVERNNLNSDGWVKQTATTKTGSGTMAGNVVRGSAAQATMLTANNAGTAAYVHVIHTPDAETGDEKGKLYKIRFESYEESFEGGGLVTFSAPFKLDGAPTPILAS
jgi:hypothetical protein